MVTKDLELGKKLNFHELHDGFENPYYLGEIKIREVSKIWEEREKTDYGVPMPEGIETIKELEIPRSAGFVILRK
jgi:hypothetical protein